MDVEASADERRKCYTSQENVAVGKKYDVRNVFSGSPERQFEGESLLLKKFLTSVSSRNNSGIARISILN